PPGLARALVRTVFHFAIVYLAGCVFLWFGYAQPEEWWWSAAAVPVTVLGALLLLPTMRRGSGYRGPHDWLSRTRVTLLPRPEAGGLAAGGAPAEVTAARPRPAEAPERVGPFAVQGALRWTGRHKLLSGTDPTLGRAVWIELRLLADPPLSPSRR